MHSSRRTRVRCRTSVTGNRAATVIFHGCGGTSTLARGATLSAGWLYEPQPISDRRWEWGFHTVRGGINWGITVFVPGLLELKKCGRTFDPWMGPSPLRVRRHLDVGPGAIFSGVSFSRLPAQPLGLTFNDTLGPNPNRMPLYPTRYVP